MGEKCKICISKKKSSLLRCIVWWQRKGVLKLWISWSLGYGFFCRGVSIKVMQWKCIIFFKSLFLLPGIYQTNYVHSNNDQGKVYQNCKCHDLGARVRVLGCGHIRHIMKIHYFFKNNSIISNRLSLENFQIHCSNFDHNAILDNWKSRLFI